MIIVRKTNYFDKHGNNIKEFDILRTYSFPDDIMQNIVEYGIVLFDKEFGEWAVLRLNSLWYGRNILDARCYGKIATDLNNNGKFGNQYVEIVENVLNGYYYKFNEVGGWL